MPILLIHRNYHSGGAEIAGNWPPAWATDARPQGRFLHPRDEELLPLYREAELMHV